MNPDMNTEAEYAYGAGHINPRAAVDPGLVYNAREIDYVEFLCGQVYSTKQQRLVTGDRHSCSKATKSNVWDLNYPSFALSGRPGKSVSRVFHRTVKNVGPAKSKYRAIVEAPKGLKIKVIPTDVLSFKSVGEEKSFAVAVTAKIGDIDSVMSASLT